MPKLRDGVWLEATSLFWRHTILNLYVKGAWAFSPLQWAWTWCSVRTFLIHNSCYMTSFMHFIDLSLWSITHTENLIIRQTSARKQLNPSANEDRCWSGGEPAEESTRQLEGSGEALRQCTTTGAWQGSFSLGLHDQAAGREASRRILARGNQASPPHSAFPHNRCRRGRSRRW
jgi:hypothetical protein